MAQIQHLIPTSMVNELKRRKNILGDFRKFHRGRFNEYLEYQADYLYEMFRDNGLSHEEALDRTRTKLFELSKEWKAAARAKHKAQKAINA